MDKFRVNKDELLERLTKNQKTHKTDHALAIKAWKKECVKALKKALKKAEEGEINLYPLQELPKPESYAEQYDDAIARVSADTRGELELSDTQFTQWWQDKWGWSKHFAATNSLYNG
jgi:hypothetical protein